MITRLYIDNYLCFSNFELELNPFTLLLGANGSGKSTVLNVIESLRRFIVDGVPASMLASELSLTRWDKRREQKFGLSLQWGVSTYEYEVVFEHSERRDTCRVKTETLLESGQPLFRFDQDGTAHFYDDDHNERAKASLDWSRSPLGMIRENYNNTKLQKFRSWMSRVNLIRPNPPNIRAKSDRTAANLVSDLRDYLNWLRGRFEEGPPNKSIGFLEDLKMVLPSLVDLRYSPKESETKALMLRFESWQEEESSSAQEDDSDFSLSFSELSEGQKLLCALYSLLHFAMEDGSALLLDEPENYLALSEIQPWLLRLEEAADEAHQVFMVSHHPEILDQAAVEHGIWLWRDDNGPVRSRPFREIADQSEGTLSASEIVARGWTEK